MGQDTTRRPAQRTLKNIVLTGGAQPDASQDMVPVVDSNNVVPRPDGTGMVSREGLAIFQKYEVVTDPPGRIALVVDTAPPNQSDGSWLLCAVDTGRANAIRAIHQFRPRTNLAGDTVISVVGFEKPWYWTIYGSSIDVYITRTGAIDRTATVHVTSVDGTAVAGVDYVAVDEDVAFAVGEGIASFSISASASASIDTKRFNLILSSVTQGCSIDSSLSSTEISIATAYSVVSCGTSPTQWDLGGNPQYAARLWISNPNAGALSAPFAAYMRDGTFSNPAGTQVYSGAMVGPDLFAMIGTEKVGTDGTARVSFTRVSKIVGTGPAYAGGLADISDAVFAHGIYVDGDISIQDFPIKYTNFGGYTVTAMYAWLIPYRGMHSPQTGSARCLIFGSDTIWYINHSNPEHPTIEKTVAIDKVTPGGTVIGEPISLWNGVYGIMLADETIVCQRTTPSGANKLPMFVRYDPETGKIINWRTNPLGLTVAGTYASRPMVPLRDGGFAIFDHVNDRVWYASSDLVTFTNLGTLDLATSPSWKATSYGDNYVLYLANVAGAAQWRIGSVTPTAFSVILTDPFDTPTVEVDKPSLVCALPNDEMIATSRWESGSGNYWISSDDQTGSNVNDIERTDADGAETIDTAFADDPPTPDPWMNELLYIRRGK